MVSFEGPLRDAIHRLKFGGERYLAGPLGGLAASVLKESPIALDILVPVPLSKKREAERGYNQSALLAREVGGRLDLPVNETSLRRTHETPPQVGLPRAERLVNLRGAFTVADVALRGQAVFLVDDVSTTGATLAACAVALRAAGVRTVGAIVLAKTR